MARWDVVLSGCDDVTHLLDIELTDGQLEAVQHLAQLSVAHGGGCRPTLSLDPSPPNGGLGRTCAQCWQPIGPENAKRLDRDHWQHIGPCPDPETGARP
jgi:hypothetical protein